ncbi:hypothetical protein [Citreimonas salinaria]|uniref:Uncharacterized protein n=1 Tax=Citreimonas salinaria TaxID=321339 RepID=A0A1H3KSN3_9RHOB|nr:hypothetical protein [Citreimonas salinaria]SDY54685.1 hypothetical protein SAMN05444340_11061 [Citreimonas salinaria]
MAEKKSYIQPGPIFYDVFLGYLRVMGTNLKEWCVPHGVAGTNAKAAATGAWNGPKAKELRERMIETVGRDTFEKLYAERIRQEVA